MSTPAAMARAEITPAAANQRRHRVRPAQQPQRLHQAGEHADRHGQRGGRPRGQQPSR
ncbi:hypothetical protein ACTWPT_09200 [Nonomuraea sp. 3N208]|uniref:hypothetical protein n=1 Tax=Nonomuraea sp. 3N208 TaxID=3457421 RepID=UPI003FCCD99E